MTDFRSLGGHYLVSEWLLALCFLFLFPQISFSGPCYLSACKKMTINLRNKTILSWMVKKLHHCVWEVSFTQLYLLIGSNTFTSVTQGCEQRHSSRKIHEFLKVTLEYLWCQWELPQVTYIKWRGEKRLQPADASLLYFPSPSLPTWELLGT